MYDNEPCQRCATEDQLKGQSRNQATKFGTIKRSYEHNAEECIRNLRDEISRLSRLHNSGL